MIVVLSTVKVLAIRFAIPFCSNAVTYYHRAIGKLKESVQQQAHIKAQFSQMLLEWLKLYQVSLSLLVVKLILVFP